MNAYMVDPDSDLGRWTRDQMTRITVHDEPCRDVWLCGQCPYMNHGPICTKCGAPAYEGKFIGGTVVRP